MDKLLFIYNPHAGQGKVNTRLSEILDAFTYHHFLPTVYPTRAGGDAQRIVEELGPEFDRVVCCGGDGTLHEVVSGLMELDDPPVLGYIPAGTTNDFSRNLNLPLDMALAAGVAVTGPTARCDMGRFNGAPYVYVAAFGAFTDVSYDTPQGLKNLFGHLAYVLNGVGRLPRELRTWHARVEADGQVFEEDLLLGMVANTRSVAGMRLPENDPGARRVKLDDGLFEVLLVRRPKWEVTPTETEVAEAGGPWEGRSVIYLHAARVTFTFDQEVPWTLDGEFGGRCREADIQAVKKALALCYRPRS